MLRAAGIPAGSLVNDTRLRTLLQRHGLRGHKLEPLTPRVLPGFHRWVSQRHAQLPLRLRWSPAWLKIRATAVLCAYLHRHSLVDYVLVSARLAA